MKRPIALLKQSVSEFSECGGLSRATIVLVIAFHMSRAFVLESISRNASLSHCSKIGSAYIVRNAFVINRLDKNLSGR